MGHNTGSRFDVRQIMYFIEAVLITQTGPPILDMAQRLYILYFINIVIKWKWIYKMPWGQNLVVQYICKTRKCIKMENYWMNVTGF